MPDAGHEQIEDESTPEDGDASELDEPTVEHVGEVNVAGEVEDADIAEDVAGEVEDAGIAEDAGGSVADATMGAVEVDPCEPSPCGIGLVCQRIAPGTAHCAASCAKDEIGCQPGDRCVDDEDCQASGDVGASCEPLDKVCVTVCGPRTIVSRANLEATKYCREIDGDLLLDPNFESIDASAFPYLTRVRRDLSARSSAESTLTSVTLLKLQQVDGIVRFASLARLEQVDLPRLSHVGGLLVTIAPGLERVALPQLAVVAGGLGLVGLPKLTQVDLGRLATIDGDLSLRVLCVLPWSQVAPLTMLGESQSITEIGCCNTLGSYSCTTSNSCVCN